MWKKGIDGAMFRVGYILASLALLIFLCTACGPRFPTTDPTVGASEKKAVLIVTPPGLNPSVITEWKTIAQAWRQNDAIAYEWLSDTKALDEPFLQRIADKPIDTALVIGNDLTPEVIAAAKQTPSIYWIILQTDLDRTGVVKPEGDNVQLHFLDPLPALKANDAWVRMQLDAGATIQWVTRTNWPIPVQWAPSEEADHLVNLDLLGDTWFSQLASQARATGTTEIVVYAPLQAAEAAKIKTLHLPVLDLFSALSPTIRWDAVAKTIHDSLMNKEWKAGNLPYSEQEASISGAK